MNPKDYKDKVYKIIGAAMEVHRNLSGGLLEPIYNEALVMEPVPTEEEDEDDQWYEDPYADVRVDE